MELKDIKNRIQEINPELNDEILDLILEYVIKGFEKRISNDVKKMGITSYSKTFS